MFKKGLLLLLVLAVVTVGCSRAKTQQGTLTGHIQDVFGAPISGTKAEVAAITTTTDNQGNYSISVPSGAQLARLSRNGFLPSQCNVTIEPNATVSLNATLYRTGKVVLQGTVKSSDDTTVTNCIITSNGLTLASGNSAGSFTVEAPSGNTVVLFSAAEFTTFTLNITTTEGTFLGYNVVLLKAGEAPSTAKAEISGLVFELQSGTPIAGALISAESTATTSNEVGEFTLQLASAGIYTITCTKESYRQEFRTTNARVGTPVTIIFRLSSTLPGSVSGCVTDEVTGAALPGAVISCQNSVATTTALGAYSLANLSPGTQTVIATLAHHNAKTYSVPIFPREERTFNITLMPNTGTLEGRVVRASSLPAPIEAALVEVLGTSLAVSTNASGYFQILHVPTGERAIRFSASNNAGESISTALTLSVPLLASAATEVTLHALTDTNEPNEDFPEATNLSMPVGISSYIWTSTDKDYFSLSLSQTRAYTFTLSVIGAKDVQYYLEPYDATLTRLTQIYAGSSAGNETKSEALALTAGTYYIRVRCGFGKFNQFDRYTALVQ